VLLGSDACFLRFDNASWQRGVNFIAPFITTNPNPVAGLMGPIAGSQGDFWCVLFYEGRAVYHPNSAFGQHVHVQIDIPAPPAIPPKSTLRQPLLQGKFTRDDAVLVHWICSQGRSHFLELPLDNSAPMRVTTSRNDSSFVMVKSTINPMLPNPAK